MDNQTPLFDVVLPNWSGPLELLLDLIRASKVKIQEISIKKITHDYLEAIKEMKKMDMNLTADFMAMASHLIYIKSKMLLPNEFEDEKEIEDPKKEFIEKLLNYEKYKLAAENLNQLSQHDRSFIESNPGKKAKKKLFSSGEWEKVDMIDLIKAFSKITESLEAPPILSDKEFKTEEKIDLIRKELKFQQKINFNNLFKKESLKQEIIVTLWAVLEMYKISEIDILQNKTFGDIFIFSNTTN